MKSIQLFNKLSIVLLLAIMGGLFAPQASSAQNGTDSLFFEQTGHEVKNEFLAYFQKYGGLEIFGYPITEQFVDQGLLVQYFQKARLELHPENPVQYRVQLGLLGEELKYRQPPVTEPTPRSRRKVFFPETGHTVSYAFLDFFNENGGIDIFGYPITEMYFEEGQIVQYFQRLKLQWQPNDPANAVIIDNLGEIYLSIYGDRMPPEALRPRTDAKPATAGTAVPSELHAMVSLRYSVMTAKRNQTVTVLVTDNNGDYVENARVEISFIETDTNKVLPNSSQTLLTNKRGFANASLPVNEGRSGTNIIVRVIVTYGELSTTAKNIFLLWW
ncbi:MAG: hypothetical protein ACK2UI_01520 [Anaerolineae bacterium]